MTIYQRFCALVFGLRAVFRRKQVDQELKDELRDHLELQMQENLMRGMSPEEARYSALRALGGLSQTEEQCRDVRGVNFVQDFLQDLRYGFRQLRRSPGFSVLAVLCLTLGIGANATVLSWVEGILFRPYPLVAHQERLFALAGATRDERSTETSWPDLLDLKENCRLIDSLIVSKITAATLSIGDRADVTTGSIVSANYFDALGVQPIMGRRFETGEDTGSNAHPVVVISYQLWKQRFSSDPRIIGKTQRFNDVVLTIVGVAPQGFFGTFVGWAMNFWVPASMEDAFESGGYKLDDRGARWAETYVRLKPGVTREQAQQEISAIASRLEADYPATDRGHNMRLWPLWQTPFNNAGALLPTLEIMLAVAGFVFLIACANVSNLLLVRSFARRQEMTIRLAIGASRARLLKQLLTEGLPLSALGATAGLLLAYWCRPTLALLLPARSGIAMHLPGALDARVLIISAAISFIATLIVGLVPALQARSIDLAAALKTESTSVVGPRRAWGRSSLIVLQVCLSFVLIVGAVLLTQSLYRLRTASPGFSTSRVLTTAVPLVAAGYDIPKARIFQEELIDRVRSLPGVDSAAYARVTPLGYRSYSSSPIAVDGYVPPPGEQPTVEYNQVGPDYFATMGIPLISGRGFTRADDQNAHPVTVVNGTMAARYWPHRDPVGQRLQVKGKWFQVVGIARNSKYASMGESPRPFFYVPLRQDFARGPALYIRTKQPVQTIVAALTREVRALDPNLALYETITLQEQVDRSTAAQLVAVTLVAILAGLALLLASVGLYGVMSYAVSQSTREMGLRMALGASPSSILRIVISRGLTLTAAGILVGFGLAVALARLLGGYLYKVNPHDPQAFGIGCAVMTITAIGACLLPGWRAMRTDPGRALRD